MKPSTFPQNNACVKELRLSNVVCDIRATMSVMVFRTAPHRTRIRLKDPPRFAR